MKRSVPSRFWLVAAVLTVVPSSTLLGPPTMAYADEQAEKEAKGHFQTGLTLYKEGAYDAALVEFNEAYRLGGRASALRNVAQCQRDLKDFAAAHASFEKLLAVHSKDLSSDERQAVSRALSELALVTGFIDLKIAEVGANVEVDDKPAATTPLAQPIRANVGVHRVRVSKPGFLPFQGTATVVAERTATVEVALQAEVRTGHVLIRAKDDAKVPVMIDGALVGTAPWEGDLPPGQHTLQLKDDRSSSTTQTLMVETGSRHEVTLDAIAEASRVEISASPPGASIEIDGKLMGAGRWAGELAPGKHVLRVSAPRSLPVTADIEVTRGLLLTQNIMLPDAPEPSAGAAPAQQTWDGIYFGLGLHADILGKAVEHPECPANAGATCKRMQPMGGALLGRLGYSFGFVGVEVAAAARFQMYEDTREFQDLPEQRYEGSPYLPYAFYRREVFQGYDFGTYVGVGPRLNSKGNARFTLGAAMGANIRAFTLSRSVPSAAKTRFTASYVAPSLMFDVGIMLGNTPGAKVVMGFLGQIDFPGELATDPDARYFEEVLKDKTDIPYSAPPPAYTLASGAQLFFGPVIGAQWGY